MIYKKEIRKWTTIFAVLIVKKAIELKKLRVDQVLTNQLLRSGTSVGANVKEAKASSSRKELIRFYEIALRSCNETEFWLEVIEQGYGFKKEVFDAINIELKEIAKVIAVIIINLKTNNK